MAGHNLALKAHAGVHETAFAVTMRSLVEIHEIHVDGFPREVAIKLGVQVNKRLAQIGQATDPHFSRRESMHPQDQAGT